MNTFQDIRRPIEQEFHAYEKLYAATLKSDNPLLHEVLDYISAKQGKQFRSQLVLLAAKVCHGVTEKSIKTAVALELMHTASLVHDDVVDASPFRRGMESVQERWTNKVAVLVGDYLLSVIMGIVTDLRHNRILNILSGVAKNLSAGELLQLYHKGSMWIDENCYYQIIEQKTACLFAACMEAGAESSGCTMRQATALREFGLHLGMCFQLKDDVLDYSDSEDIGKPTMNDIRDGKVTLPLLISLLRAPKSEAEALKQRVEQPLPVPEDDIRSFVLRYDGIGYAYQQMQKHKQKAIEALSCFHDSPAKSGLMQLLDYSINRLK